MYTKTGRRFAWLAGLVAVFAIALLTANVSREIRLLGSARSDNVQWSLVQTQVEFLGFKQQVDLERIDPVRLRQEFDVFYSRITTLREAAVFTGLRANPTSGRHLDGLVAFLEAAVPVIDSPDAELLRQVPQLRMQTGRIAPTMRALGNSALDMFAQSSDAQRNAVARTLMQLALAIAALIGVLLMAISRLYALNVQINRREREKRRTTTRMTTVINTSLDGVIVTDAQGQILEFSPAAEHIFGHMAADMLGTELGVIIDLDHIPDGQHSCMERMHENAGERVVGQGRVTMAGRHRDGRIFPIELAIQSATTDEGEIFVTFVRDISQRVAAEAELISARDTALASEKLKTEFLSTMSHEIRTPLNGLLGNMNLMRDTVLTPKQDRYLGYMETSGRLLLSHVSDVLDITRYDAGKLSTRSEPVSISGLFQAIVDNQKCTAAKNETVLTWGWQGTPLDWVMSDQDRLQHVMMNLIGNAVKFTRGGQVTVTVENIGTPIAPELSIRIADTGPGMTEELAAQVFDDFVTGNAAYDRDVGGTGLGLSIARRFVKALGGEIGVESAVGEGSTFWVRLPVQETEAPASAPKTPAVASDAPAQGRLLTVLLVEDNEINRIVAREMLQFEGHTVVEAHDGKQGVAAARSTCFDLILMDISMPVMDGRTATHVIRSEEGASKDAPIIALTANAMAEEQKEFLAAGMDGILTKPVSREALRSLLHRTGTAAEIKARVVLNEGHIAQTRDALGEDAFVTLKAQFAGEVDSLRAWFAHGMSQDYLEIAGRAHKVAGSAAVFGAEQLREALRAIEAGAKRGDSQAIEAGVAAFGAIWQRTKPQLAA